DRVSRPVGRRHRAAGRRGGAARGVAGSPVPGRDRLPAAAAFRHRAGRAAARLPARGSRHAGRGGARLPPGEGPLGGRLVGPPAPRGAAPLRRPRRGGADRPPRRPGGRAGRAGQDRMGPPGIRGRARGPPGRGPGVVRELWSTRDRIAQVADLSPRRVLPDTAIVDAARSYPANHAQLIKISGFAGRQARRHEKDWLAAVARARASADSELPETTGGTAPNRPPPAHRWAERDPAAAERLAAARAVVTALATDSRLPVENLLSPDALRRLSWDPPPVTDEPSVAQALAS